jgi:hypothetical protein
MSLVEALQHGQRHLDWHPGSNEQVLDLVHPSLFPLVFGVTRAVDESQAATCIDDWQKMVGGGELVQPGGKFKFLREANDRRHGNQQQSWSRLSQWLPTEVAVSADGSRVQFLSYINNLHPGQSAVRRARADFGQVCAAVPKNPRLPGESAWAARNHEQ